MINMIRSIITSVAEGVIKRFTGAGRPNETFTNREYIQHYGYTSRPLPNAEGIVLANGNNIIMIATDDRRYRLEIEEGEVALYTDEGDFVHFKRGNLIHVSSKNKLLEDITNDVEVNTIRHETNASESAIINTVTNEINTTTHETNASESVIINTVTNEVNASVSSKVNTPASEINATASSKINTPANEINASVSSKINTLAHEVNATSIALNGNTTISGSLNVGDSTEITTTDAEIEFEGIDGNNANTGTILLDATTTKISTDQVNETDETEDTTYIETINNKATVYSQAINEDTGVQTNKRSALSIEPTQAKLSSRSIDDVAATDVWAILTLDSSGVAGTITITGNVTINGDLHVTGTTT